MINYLTYKRHHVQYTGLDIARTVIDSVRKKYPSKENSNLRFENADMTLDVLPYRADMMWTRDTLQHLSESNIRRALANFKRADPTWLVIGGYVKDENQNIADGSAFYFSPLKPPYNLYPEFILYETHAKHLFVFNRQQVQQWNF